MPNKAKKGVYKEKEFGIYVLWKSLPPHFKGMKKSELNALGFTDPFILKIIKIKNQTEFAKYFHIKDLGTLTDWNNKIKLGDVSSPLLMTDFQKQCSSINQKIVQPNIDELRKKITEQNKIISLLKSQNTSLRKKTKPAISDKGVKIIRSKMATQEETIFPEPVEENYPVDKKTETVLRKIMDIFSK